jgi:hypothetical protein
VATYGAENWTWSKDIAKRLAAFERKISRRMFRGIKVNETWRKRYNKELMQLFADLDMLSFVRIRQLNGIGLVNRMNRKRKVT